MKKLTNYALVEANQDLDAEIANVQDYNAKNEQTFNGIYIVFENGKMFAENEQYDRIEVPQFIIDDIDEILSYVHACGDDISAFDCEVEAYLKNNGYSLKRTSNGDFGRFLYE